MTVDDLLRQVDIVELISEKVELKRVGSQYRGLCPFHRERTPSFYVSPDLGVYHCFGCGASGNAITFVMETEGLSFREAVEYLARKFNIPFEWEKKRDKKSGDLYEIMDMAHNFFVEHLKSHPPAINYLHSRGVKDEFILRFQIGYAPADRDALTRYLLNKGVGMDRLIQLGLTRRTEDGHFLDFFRGRIMFPVFSHDGRFVLGFSGRVLEGGEPKYLNSPDSPIFKKGEVLFGFNLARRTIVRKRSAILVEGQMDVIGMHQMGYENAVASLGTAITPEALRRLKRIADTLYILYDSDNAGLKAAHRAMNVAVSLGFTVYIVLLDRGLDPADYMREGRHIDKIEEKSYNITAFYRMFYERVKTVEARGKVLKSFMETVNLMPDPVMRQLYVKEFADSIGISAELLETYSTRPSARSRYTEREDRVMDETYALWAIYRSGKYGDRLREIDERVFRSKVTVELFRAMLEGNLESRIKEDEKLSALGMLLESRRETFEKVMDDILHAWLVRSYELRYAQLSEEEKEKYLALIYELKRRKK